MMVAFHKRRPTLREREHILHERELPVVGQHFSYVIDIEPYAPLCTRTAWYMRIQAFRMFPKALERARVSAA